MSTRLKEGKVPWELIAGHLDEQLPDGVALGPSLGEDAALVTMGDELWAVASDPISFTATDAGRLCVLVNANDVAVRGARPVFFLAVLLVAPGEATEQRVSELLGQVKDTCDRYGICLIGGHTEVTPGISHSVVVGTMLGRVIDRPLRTGGLRPGDLVGMTKWAGLEGTSILLSDFGPKLVETHGEEVRAAREILDGDWISVVKEALEAAQNPCVTALHDVTEGGVGQALTEMAEASGLDLDIDLETIPLLPVTRAICPDLCMDPLGLIGSGAMLVGCAPAGKSALEAAFADRQIPFTWIGRAVDRGTETAYAVPRFPRDEILKASQLDGIEAVIFDMDGTLIHSDYNWRKIREQLGVTGRSILDDLNELESPEKERKLKLLEQIEHQASDRSSLKPGVPALLDLIRERGKKTALVTNNTSENTEALLERFSIQFDVVLTRDCGMWKPSGAPIRAAAHQMGLTPDRCLALGDSRFDFMAAREAGCKVVFSVFDAKGRYDDQVDMGFKDLLTCFRFLRLTL